MDGFPLSLNITQSMRGKIRSISSNPYLLVRNLIKMTTHYYFKFRFHASSDHNQMQFAFFAIIPHCPRPSQVHRDSDSTPLPGAGPRTSSVDVAGAKGHSTARPAGGRPRSEKLGAAGVSRAGTGRPAPGPSGRPRAPTVPPPGPGLGPASGSPARAVPPVHRDWQAESARCGH